jgi:predicted nucleic acid-binding protein
MPSTSERAERAFLDAGIFVAALLDGHPRCGEARPLVEAARGGHVRACTSAGILSEVYAALTWEKAEPRHSPEEAAEAVRLLIEFPSAIEVLPAGKEVALRSLALAAAHRLTARRVHDARHAATALVAGVPSVYTLDVGDWERFEADGLRIAGPVSALRELERSR